MEYILIIYLYIFIIGLAIGSFMNVCIYRIPEEKSIIKPGSMCPYCFSPIKWYDNIPLVSFIILGGRCRICKKAISFRYPLVELISGILALTLFIRYRLTITYVAYYALCSALVVVSFIDLKYRIIPDIISLPGIAVGLAISFLLPNHTFLQSILGMVIGGGSLFLVAFAYYTITKREGLGGGDVKLLAMIGSFLGWSGVIITIFFGSVIGLVSGIIMMIKEKQDTKYPIPFGPFLSIGAIIYIYWGYEIINWYLGY